MDIHFLVLNLCSGSREGSGALLLPPAAALFLCRSEDRRSTHGFSPVVALTGSFFYLPFFTGAGSSSYKLQAGSLQYDQRLQLQQAGSSSHGNGSSHGSRPSPRRAWHGSRPSPRWAWHGLRPSPRRAWHGVQRSPTLSGTEKPEASCHIHWSEPLQPQLLEPAAPATIEPRYDPFIRYSYIDWASSSAGIMVSISAPVLRTAS